MDRLEHEFADIIAISLHPLEFSPKLHPGSVPCGSTWIVRGNEIFSSFRYGVRFLVILDETEHLVQIGMLGQCVADHLASRDDDGELFFHVRCGSSVEWLFNKPILLTNYDGRFPPR